MLNKTVMNKIKNIKIVGDLIIHDVEDSVFLTLSKGKGVAKQSIHNIRIVVEDKRADSLGGINVAYRIWESAMVLYNSKSWIKINEKTMKLILQLFNDFHRMILHIGA